MSDETPWGRFPDRDQHPGFDKAYRRLDAERREPVDAAIAAAATRMHDLLNHRMLVPLPWPGLPPATAHSVDMAERTCMAMGVFRLSIAGRLGTNRTELSDGLDQAADQVDQRAVALALRALTVGHPPLASVKAADGAAYHALLNRLVRAYPAQAYSIAQCQSEPADALHLTLETGLETGVLTSIVVHQENVRRGVRARTADVVAEGPLPLEAAVALWLLAVMGLGRLFGEDDKTLAYAD